MLDIRPIGKTPDDALAAGASHAPYLRRLAERGTDLRIEMADSLLAHALCAGESGEVMSFLRRAKAVTHLSLAALDLSASCDVMQITSRLTVFAGAALDTALRAALQARGLEVQGLFIFALGKMGAFELNYSSDIDLCALYEPDRFCGGDRDPGEAAQRIIRETVRLMEEPTGEGYVFRTDLRLRPDPGSTPLAVSTSMADVYYESQGQNWERMVWIKARPAAGDIDAAKGFQQRLTPYVWRRHLDYWAIGDIQAIKRMINSKVGDDAFRLVSPDVKLSPGGIREIEFFVQTQQLILGGRDPQLRDNSTLGALEALRAAGIVTDQTARELADAYRALRNLEHRIQMRHDEQTHKVPADPAEREAVAFLCGYQGLAEFDRDLLETRRLVQAAYQGLFEQSDQAAGSGAVGNLVFTGVDDDPGTVETLSALGFSDPSAAIGSIRNWHRGRVAATRTPRGRELLTAILPGLIQAMADTGEADTAFRWFSRFFEGLSSGVQTLAMLLARPELLNDLVATLALAPRLASILARRPDLLEALISNAAPRRPEPDSEVSFDAAMDEWRRYHREQSFLLGHRLLHGIMSADAAAAAWTKLADETIAHMAAAAQAETVRRAGPAPGSWAVMALGKLGGGELTAGSDLDIMLVYDAPDPLNAQTWFTRLTQRLITALTAPTAEGALYEVDMRLRPSGRAGPVAVSLPAFTNYHNEEAWTWEHMALTRLRCVAGDGGLGERVCAIAAEAICSRARSGRRQAIGEDIRDMRRTLYREKPGGGLWDLKYAEGGLVDIEFILQRELLLRGQDWLIRPSSALALSRIADIDGPGESGETECWHFLRAALHLLSSLQQVQRLALGESEMTTLTGSVPEGLKDRFCRAAGQEGGFGLLEARLSDVKARVHELAVQKLQLGATENPS